MFECHCRGVATLFPALPGNPLRWRSGRGLGMILDLHAYFFFINIS